MLYCEDAIHPDGSFSAGVSVGCDAMIPQLNAMGIGAERIVGSPSIDNLRAMFLSPSKSISGIVALTRARVRHMRAGAAARDDARTGGSTYQYRLSYRITPHPGTTK